MWGTYTINPPNGDVSINGDYFKALMEAICADYVIEGATYGAVDWTKLYGLGVNCGGYVLHRLAANPAQETQPYKPTFAAIATVNTWASSYLFEYSPAWTDMDLIRKPVLMFQDADYWAQSKEDFFSFGAPDPRERWKHMSRARWDAAFGRNSTPGTDDCWAEINNVTVLLDGNGERIVTRAPIVNSIVKCTEVADQRGGQVVLDEVKFVSTWSTNRWGWPTLATHNYEFNDEMWDFFNPLPTPGPSGSGDEDVYEALQPKMSLESAYPNPFNASSSVKLTLQGDHNLTLAVFNILGQQVVTLHEGPLAEGSHIFSINTENMASGTYFLNARSDHGMNEIQKIVLMR